MPKDIIQKHLDDEINPRWNWWGMAKDERDEVLNCALGLAGEAGEVANLVKKMYFYEPRDGREDQLMSELGDVYFYLSKLQDLFRFTTAEILDMNRLKLEERFPDRKSVV